MATHDQLTAYRDNRVYVCPECKGEGAFTVYHSYGAWGPDPQSEELRDCGECDGKRTVVMDRHEAHELGLVRAVVSERDLLERVADLRKMQRRGAYYQQRYGEVLQLAVSPLGRALPGARAAA